MPSQSQFLPDLTELRNAYKWADARDFAINNAGDTVQKTGDYFEVVIATRMMIDRRHFTAGEIFPAVRSTGNRWIFDLLTPLQYKVPNL